MLATSARETKHLKQRDLPICSTGGILDIVETPTKTPREANLKAPWKKGDPSPNPSGRPKGQRNYATIYRAALQKIAAAKNATPEEIEDMIEQTGLQKALDGDFNFSRDLKDRLHGKPRQPIGLEGAIEGEPPTFIIKYG